MNELTITDMINLITYCDKVMVENEMNRDAKFTNRHCEEAYNKHMKLKYKVLNELNKQIDKILSS